MAVQELEVRHLRLVATISDVGSLHAASRSLHLSPSALSQQLRWLEELLGGPLFERRWRRLVPTQAGARLASLGRSFLGELGRAEEDVRRLLRGETRFIRFASACQHSYGWLPEVLRIHAASAPGVEVRLVPEAGVATCRWLADHRLDVGIVTADDELAPDVSAIPFLRDELVLVVGRKHPWFGSSRVPLADVAGEHLWLDEGALRPHTTLAKAFARVGVEPRKVSFVPPASSLGLEMARLGLGVTVSPRWTVHPATEQRAIASVRMGSGLSLRWSLVTRRGESAPAILGFAKLLQEHIRDAAHPDRHALTGAAQRHRRS